MKSGDPLDVFDGLDLEIYKGEFISFLGPSGCGKTTLLRLIADLLTPTEGSVTIGGLSAEEARKQHKYGIVFQRPVLYDWRTVGANIALPMEIMKIPKEQQKEKVSEMLKLVNLEGYESSYPYELSGGMQQRVGIARALALDSEILLMDEPFSALDEFTKVKLHEDLLRIWEMTGKTIVFVTHNINEAVYLSDRVCVFTANPARLAGIVDIGLKRPRDEDVLISPNYLAYMGEIRHIFGEQYETN